MTTFEQVLYAEPTFVGIFGAALMHAVLWLGFFGNYEVGLMKCCLGFFRSTKTYQKGGAVFRNCENDPMLEMYGDLGKKEPGIILVVSLMTQFHHGLGGALMLLGMFTGQPWIWRHGLLTEIGGLDLADTLRIIHSTLFPPGVFPICLTSGKKERAIWVILCVLHHGASTLAGLPFCLYFSDRPDFQLFGFVLLGFPAVSLIDYFPTSFFDREKHLHIHIFAKLWSTLTFTWARIIYFFPTAYTLIKFMLNEDIPSPWKFAICCSGVLMSLFNLIAIPIVFSGLFKLFKAPTPKAKVAILRQSSFNLSSSRTAAPHIHRLITDRLQTNVFVASKLIVRAQRAKAAVAKRKANEAKNKMNN